MKFLKENSYDIVKLFINQIGITIFSLVLYTAIGFVKDSALNAKIRVVLSVFATIFYLVLIYTAAWECGAKDRIRSDSGKIKRMPYKGALLSLCSNLPNFLIAGLAVVCMAIYMSGGADGFFTAFGIFNLIIRFISSMYLGILQGVFAAFSADVHLYYLLQSIGYLVMPLLAVAVTQLGYFLGERNFRIFAVLSSKNNGTNNDR